MLHEFITSYRDPIIARTREKLTDRPWPLASTSELEHGVPLFLTQLADTLRLETTSTPFSQQTIGASATKHGRELRALGFGPDGLLTFIEDNNGNRLTVEYAAGRPTRLSHSPKRRRRRCVP